MSICWSDEGIFRAIIDAIHSGALVKAKTQRDPGHL